MTVTIKSRRVYRKNTEISPEGAENLPVLVFLHGGNNQTGNTKELIGSELVVKDECVFVTLNYRLGIFGFKDLRKNKRFSFPP